MEEPTNAIRCSFRGSLESTNVIEPLYPFICATRFKVFPPVPRVKLLGAGEFILNKLSSLLHLSPSPSQAVV